MRASFSSRDVDNHTAFIRIKTNAPNEDQFIILPVEVEVTSGVLPQLLWISSIPDILLILLGKCCASFLQPLVYTPPQRCLTSVRCGHKVWRPTNDPTVCLHQGFFVHSPSAWLSSHRSPQAAESAPFKFRNKRCSDYSRYPDTPSAFLRAMLTVMWPLPLFMLHRVYAQHHPMKQSQ